MEYFQMIMALIGVLAIVFALFFLLKKLNNHVGLYDSSHMKILERINIGPDKMLLLVSVCGKCMVLCVTNGHTEKICELDETEEELTAKPEGANPSFAESFKTVFSQMMKRNRK